MANLTNTQQIIISGEAHGSGSHKWRWVSRLSQEAKGAIANKTALVICERPFDDSMGKWYVVTDTSKASTWDHRLPTDIEAKQITAAGL